MARNGILENKKCITLIRPPHVKRKNDIWVFGETLLNPDAVFDFWDVIFSFMLKEEEKISMVSPELLLEAGDGEPFLFCIILTSLLLPSLQVQF